MKSSGDRNVRAPAELDWAEGRVPTEAEFERFRTWGIRFTCGWLAAFALIIVGAYLVDATWMYAIAGIGGPILGATFPGITVPRLALGSYEQFAERFPIAMAKERERARRQSKTSMQGVREWSVFTKLVIILGFGLPSGFFFLIYLKQGDWGLLVAAMILATIPVALIVVMIRSRLSSRPKPE